MPFITRMSSWNTSSCVWEWWVRTLESFPVPDWDLFHKWAPQMLLKPHYGELHPDFVNRIHTGPWYFQGSSIPNHLPRPTDGWVRIAKNPKRLPQLNTSPQALGKAPYVESCVLHLVYRFNTGSCLLPNPVHSGSFHSPKRWVRVAKKTKRLNTIFTVAYSGSSTVPNRWVRIARNPQRFIYNRLISPLMHELMQLHSRPFRIINRAKQMGENS